jgi:hypothetical protein
MTPDPDKEYKCPSCGGPLAPEEDVSGWTFQCWDVACGEFFEADEILEPAGEA